MKKNILLLTSAFCLLTSGFWPLPSAFSQQFQLHTNVTYAIPPVIWRGTNAQVIARQLLNLTNADGTFVVPANFLTNRSSTIFIRVEAGTNGLQSIRARIQ